MALSLPAGAPVRFAPAVPGDASRPPAAERLAQLECAHAVARAVMADGDEETLFALVAAQARLLAAADAAGVLLAEPGAPERWLVEPATARRLTPAAARRRVAEGTALTLALGAPEQGRLVLLWPRPQDGRAERAGRLLAPFLDEARTALAHASRRAQERVSHQLLRDSELVVQRFVATLSHELRSPLTSIGGFLELLLAGTAGELSEHQRSYLEIAERNTRRLRALVEDLLTLSALRPPEPRDVEPLAVDEWLRYGAAELELAAAGSGVRLQVTPVDQPLVVEGVPEQLDQVVRNLLGNAIKFSPDGGAVSVAARAVPEGVELEVADSGIGIAGADLPCVFDRFFRGATATGARIQGTGLGLAIVREIVVAHGGRVWADSVEGRGSRFHVVLPVAGR